MTPERARVLSEGLVAGLLGYAVIAMFFGFLHLFTGQSLFHTAAALGEGLVSHDAAIIGGAAAGSVIAFNGVHMLAFVLFGVIAAWLVSHAERNPGFFIVMLFLGLAGFLPVPGTSRTVGDRSDQHGLRDRAPVPCSRDRAPDEVTLKSGEHDGVCFTSSILSRSSV
jgi:hypothetical protein